MLRHLSRRASPRERSLRGVGRRVLKKKTSLSSRGQNDPVSPHLPYEARLYEGTETKVGGRKQRFDLHRYRGGKRRKKTSLFRADDGRKGRRRPCQFKPDKYHRIVISRKSEVRGYRQGEEKKR